jgi:hypothetical protein
MALALARWAFAFFLTQAIEIPIYVRGARMRPLAAGGASALTHPVVCFAMPPLADAIYASMYGHGLVIVSSPTFRLLGFALLAEGFAVGAEALYLCALKVKRALLWSLVANFASASAGYLSWSLFGFP